jgi:hypothetical protein
MTTKPMTKREKARRDAALDRVPKHLEVWLELTAAEQRTLDRYMRRIIAARKAQAK